jgi:hypothetical protein
MRFTIGTFGLGALAIAVASFAAGRLTVRAPAAPPPAPAPECPELTSLDPRLSSLSLPDLERRYHEGYPLPPSTFDKQLASLRASAEAYVPARRTCMTKVMLVHAIVNQEQALRSTPANWGLSRPSEEIRKLYLTLPLMRARTDDERLDVVAQLEENIVAGLAKGSPDDAEHWRRRYYGLLVLCSVTDDALAGLGAARPSDCLNLEPRPQQHDKP